MSARSSGAYGMLLMFFVVAILAAYVTATMYFVNASTGFGLSDDEAVAITEEFASRLGIGIEGKPSVDSINPFKGVSLGLKGSICLSVGKAVRGLSSGRERLKTMFFRNGFAMLDCREKALVMISVSDSMVKYYESRASRGDDFSKPMDPAEFVPLGEAEKKILSVGEKAGIPEGAAFKGVVADERMGFYTGDWVVERDGYEFLEPHLSVQLFAPSGDVSRITRIVGRHECQSEARIGEDEAMGLALKSRARTAEVNKNPASELRPVGPRYVIMPYGGLSRPGPCRLAWVYEYDIKLTYDPEFEKELGKLPDSYTHVVIIDAADGKYLAGD